MVTILARTIMPMLTARTVGGLATFGAIEQLHVGR
jgi:hypothetical protein